jgi:hypothetical protein
MSPLARSMALAYVLMLLILASIGAAGQLTYRHQARLLLAKEQALVEIAAARAAAAGINGPLAVAAFARSSGMVPAPDAKRVAAVAGGLIPPPSPPIANPYLEVVTQWR